MSAIANITLVSGDEVFLVKRAESQDLYQPGKWASVGGSVDPGESPETAALREFSEELGIDLRAMGITEESLMRIPSRPDGDNIIHSFAVQLTKEQKERIHPDNLNWENSDAKWLPIRNLPSASDMHPEYIQTVNLIGRWFVDENFIGVGNRAGVDYNDSTYSALEKQEATHIFEKELAYPYWQREFAKQALPVIENTKEGLLAAEQEKQDRLNAFEQDKIRADKLFEQLDQIPLHKYHRGVNQTLSDYLRNERWRSISEYALRDVLGATKTGVTNFFARRRALTYFETAKPIIQELQNFGEKHNVSFLDGQYREDSSFVSRLNRLNGERNKAITDDLSDFTLRLKSSDTLNQAHRYAFKPFFVQGNPLESVEKYLLKRMAEANQKLNGDEIAKHHPVMSLHLTKGLAEELGEPYFSAFNEAAENSSLFDFATEEQRARQLGVERVQKYGQNAIARDNDVTPGPREGMTRVFHSSSRVFEKPSEEYMTRSRLVSKNSDGTVDRIRGGAVFDGMGFYTTDHADHAATYIGGESCEGKLVERFINGFHTYAYDIALNKDVNFIELNERRDYDQLSESMRRNLDAVLAPRYGLTLQEMERRTGEKLHTAKEINGIHSTDGYTGNPLIAYGLSHSELLDVLKEAGITAKRGQNGTVVSNGAVKGAIVIIDTDKLEPVSRFEIEKAPPALEALQKLHPDEAREIGSLSNSGLADRYFAEVMKCNNGIVTDYHEGKLLESLIESKGLSLGDAQNVVRDSKNRIPDFDYHRVYQGYERPAKYSMDRPYVVQDPVKFSPVIDDSMHANEPAKTPNAREGSGNSIEERKILPQNTGVELTKAGPAAIPLTASPRRGHYAELAKTAQSTAAHGIGAANVAVDIGHAAFDIKEGRLGDAAKDIGKAAVDAAFTVGPKVAEALEVVQEAKGVLGTAVKATGAVAKRLPIAGAVLTAGTVAYEVGEHALNGDWGKAGVAGVAGAAEIGGNIAGFGVGDAAREAVRAGAISALGDEYAVNKSGLRTLGEDAVDLVQRTTGSSDHPHDFSILKKEAAMNSVDLGTQNSPASDPSPKPVTPKPNYGAIVPG